MRTWHTFPWRKSDERAERPCESVPLAANDRKTIPSIDPPWCKTRREWRKGTCIARRSACNCPEREGERERGRITRDLSLHVSYPNPIRLLVDRRFTKPAKGRTATINRSKAVPPVRVDVQLDGESIWWNCVMRRKRRRMDETTRSIDRFRAGWIEKQCSILLPDFREI